MQCYRTNFQSIDLCFIFIVKNNWVINFYDVLIFYGYEGHHHIGLAISLQKSLDCFIFNSFQPTDFTITNNVFIKSFFFKITMECIGEFSYPCQKNTYGIICINEVFFPDLPNHTWWECRLQILEMHLFSEWILHKFD